MGNTRRILNYGWDSQLLEIDDPADHPATGGNQVIAVVHPDDLVLIAQARPGASVVFCGP